jgi:transcriptional regulator with XRE-family HTH domain
MDHIAQRIEQIRKEKELSQKDVAQRLGVIQPYYSRAIKRGENLTIGWIQKIAAALEVDPCELICPDSVQVKEARAIEKMNTVNNDLLTERAENLVLVFLAVVENLVKEEFYSRFEDDADDAGNIRIAGRATGKKGFVDPMRFVLFLADFVDEDGNPLLADKIRGIASWDNLFDYFSKSPQTFTKTITGKVQIHV